MARKFRNQIFLMLLVTAIVVSLNGIALAAPVTITMVVNHGIEDAPLFVEVAEMFMEKNPNIKIEVQNVPSGGSDYYQKLTVMGASNTLPDIFYMRGGSGDTRFYRMGFAHDLTPLVERDAAEVDIDDLIDAQLRELQYPEGVWRALPYDYSTVGLYYNKELFDEAGVAYPADDWTWDDLIAAARKLTKTRGNRVLQYGLAHTPAFAVATQWMEGMILSEGGVMFTEDYSKCIIDDPKTVEIFEKWADIALEYRAAPLPGETAQENVYFTGRAAMAFDGSWGTMGHRNMCGFPFDVAMLPQGPDGKRVCGATGGSWAISKDTKHLEEAWEFVKYLASPEAQRVLIVDPVRSLPARKSLLDEWAAQITKTGLDPQNARIFATEAELYGKNTPVLPIDYMFVIENKLPQIAKEPVDTVLKSVAEEINQLLDEAK